MNEMVTRRGNRGLGFRALLFNHLRSVPLQVCYLGLMVFLWGCTSAKPYQAIDANANLGRTLSVVYSPTQKDVYVEVNSRSRRYADFEVSVVLTAASSLTASSLGAFAGYWGAVAAAPSNAIVVVNPVAMAVAVLAAPIIGTTVEATKQAGARRKAEPFNKLVAARDGDWTFYPALSLVVDRELGKSFQTPVLYTLDHVEENFDEDEFLESLATDRVLVVSAITAFTPRFEVLETALLYGLFDSNQGFKMPVYSNGVVVQSKVHAGKLGADTRHEINEIVQLWVAKNMALTEQRYKNSGAPTRNAAKRQVQQTGNSRIKRREMQYYTFDDHDKEGELWLEDDGSAFFEALESGYAEAARLMAADLQGSWETQTAETVTPPGYQRDLYRVKNLDLGDRVVYRLIEGPLVSIDARSRFIPLSK